MAGGLGARAHVGGRDDDSVREVLRARDAALPVRRAAHGAPEELLRRRRRRALPPPHRAGACCTRWATTRSACRPRTTRSARGEHPRDSTAESIAAVPARVPLVGHLDRLVARVRHPRAALLPLDAVDLPASSRARPGLPRGGGRQLVPEGRDRARQRAGHRRPLRALRHAGRGAPARAVVLPHHRLRRPPARRPRDDRVARARQDDAAQLDRALRGRRGHVPRARARASTTRSSPRGPTRCSARRSS